MNGVLKVIGCGDDAVPEIKSGTAGATINEGDLLKGDDSGGLTPATAGDTAIEGVAIEDASSSDTVHYKRGPRLRVLMDNDNDSTTLSSSLEFEYADITGGTGAQQVDTDTHSTTKAQLKLLEANPQGYGYNNDTSVGLYEVTERA